MSEGEFKKRIETCTHGVIVLENPIRCLTNIIDEAKHDFPIKIDEQNRWHIENDWDWSKVQKWFEKWFGENK